MKVCKKPIETERFTFLFKHLDCDCIADTSNEDVSDTISVVAYSEGKHENEELYDYFFESGMSDKYRYLKGITREEVDCIE